VFDCGSVLALLFRGGRPVFDLAARDIDHELGELGGIAGAFPALL
jgi:hypothetical protein